MCSRSDAVGVCDSSHAIDPVPPSPPAPWRTSSSLSSKRLSWYDAPCCRSMPIESSRLLLAVEDSALRQRFRRLLWPLLTSPCPSCAVANAVVRFAYLKGKTGTSGQAQETSQGKSCHLPSVPAGFTCARVRMAIGRPRPLPGYPTAPASYPVPVRRVRVLLSASFRSRLATGTLA